LAFWCVPNKNQILEYGLSLHGWFLFGRFISQSTSLHRHTRTWKITGGYSGPKLDLKPRIQGAGNLRCQLLSPASTGIELHKYFMLQIKRTFMPGLYIALYCLFPSHICKSGWFPIGSQRDGRNSKLQERCGRDVCKSSAQNIIICVLLRDTDFQLILNTPKAASHSDGLGYIPHCHVRFWWTK
jgi:hypothetical protein